MTEAGVPEASVTEAGVFGATPRRLAPATLAGCRAGVALPGYDRARLRPGIVHLGLGAFARAHLACITDDALALVPGDWGITGVSLRRAHQRDLLAPQHGLYTALEREAQSLRVRVVGCLQTMLVAPESPQAVLAALADPACRIVSLTITEKGYCHDPATGALDDRHPDIVHDLDHPDTPRSAVGLITQALARRLASGQAPFTVLSCDNLPHNGRLLAGLVQGFASLRDARLAGWIAQHGAFPATMVDRIVPAATAADIADSASATGLFDAAPVSHEPFRQWVIEDRFIQGARPAWERAGAQMVADVTPYEHMKLRLLNGAHSALAYLGSLAGHETIADVMADPVFARFLARLWREEIIPVVPPPPGVDLGTYAEDLRARFANTAIRHRTLQIAMDGSQKLPQRLLASIRERLARGLGFPLLALAVAGWIRHVGGVGEDGAPIAVQDPLAGPLQAALGRAGADPARQVAAMAEIQAVFGADLRHDTAFMAEVTQALRHLRDHGARGALERV